MSEESQPIVNLTDVELAALLNRATRLTLYLGVAIAAALWIGSTWQNAALVAVGAGISAGSILEWKRLIQIINAKLDHQKLPRGVALVVVFFFLRLILFAAVIYASLKCLHGSVVALLSGLCLAVVAVAWEALRLLRD